MPIPQGFNLYAFTIYFTDGKTCVCYARKEDEWYYFSTSIDFRIQLNEDNTLKEQEWKRIYEKSSWYESAMIDHVQLMEFGEKYLQTELNPMRDDISENHTTIVNNYNEYIVNRNNMWNALTYNGGYNGTQEEYEFTIRNILKIIFSGFELIYKELDNVQEVFAANFNQMRSSLKKLASLTIGSSDDYIEIPQMKILGSEELPFLGFNDATGDAYSTILPYRHVEDSGAVTQEYFNNERYMHILDNIQLLFHRYGELDNRVTALENK